MSGPKMYTRSCDAGQIVEVSYGYSGDGYAWCCVRDNSDRSEQWYRGEIDWDREPEDEVDPERAPRVVEWVACNAPIGDADERGGR